MQKFKLHIPDVEDLRWRSVNATMRQHGYEPDALIETLHTVQEEFGYLDENALRYVAESLSVPLSRVYGVATFYNHFTLKPRGKHSCTVCTGTACYIKGAADVLAELEDHFGVKAGDTTPDGTVSLLTARCVGACGLAPLALADNEVLGLLDSGSVVDRVEEWIDHES